MHAGYIGPELPVPSPTVPLFVRNIISSSKFSCSRENTRINERPYDVVFFGSKWLTTQILDEQLLLPILVLVQQDELLSAQDAEKLHKRNL